MLDESGEMLSETETEAVFNALFAVKGIFAGITVAVKLETKLNFPQKQQLDKTRSHKRTMTVTWIYFFPPYATLSLVERSPASLSVCSRWPVRLCTSLRFVCCSRGSCWSAAPSPSSQLLSVRVPPGSSEDASCPHFTLLSLSLSLSAFVCPPSEESCQYASIAAAHILWLCDLVL